MAGNTSFNQLATTTLNNYINSGKMEDNIFGATQTLNAIKTKSGITTKGGLKLLLPLMYAKNSTVQSMTPYGVFDTTPQDGFTAAEYTWANLGGTVVLDNLTIQAQNAGDSQVINLLEAKVSQLEQSMTDLLCSQLWEEYNDTTAYALNSIPQIVYGGNPTKGNLGGIEQAANTWWTPAIWSGTGQSQTASNMPASDATISIANLNHMYNYVSNGSDRPDLFVMPLDLYEAFEALLFTNMRFQDDKLANAGIENIKLKGASVIFDANCTSGVVYCLNTKYLKFVNCQGRNMQATAFEAPHNQDVSVSKIIWSGQLGCSNRKRQAAWTSCTAA